MALAEDAPAEVKLPGRERKERDGHALVTTKKEAAGSSSVYAAARDLE
jgi:hypothetical protein